MLSAATFRKWRPRLRVVGDNVLSVDVVVTTCKEPLAVLQDTILAVLALDYPAHRFRVIVGDDGNDAALRAWVGWLAQSRDNVYYTARVKSGPAGYKAGNLNHCIAFADTLPGGPAELVGGLDADMIPEKKWLRSMTAHLALDAGMGMACPSQVSVSLRAALPRPYLTPRLPGLRSSTTALPTIASARPCTATTAACTWSETWPAGPGTPGRAGWRGGPLSCPSGASQRRA